VPPTSEQPLIVRSTEYLGSRPTIKRSMVVAVDDLPLKNEIAKKRLILMAGSRWTPNPPTDAGISNHAEWGHGFVKISCEDFQQPARNLKWISDTLDKLVERANVSGSDRFFSN
jgi:small subunit ribosomal protein S35